MVDTDDTRRTTDDGRRTTPWVWHKLPTGELKTAERNSPSSEIAGGGRHCFCTLSQKPAPL